MADAAKQDGPDPEIMDMMDIKKAYPNSSRNAMDRALKLVGVPPKVRNMMQKLDSLTQYRCRTSVGTSEPYTTLRGCRGGCPAAPVKFNVLHHVATMQLRKAWDEAGVSGSVTVETFDKAEAWPGESGTSRTKVAALKPAQVESKKAIDVVGYADDTTILARSSDAVQKREITCKVYEEWGHTTHPGKWRRLWSGKRPAPFPRRKLGKAKKVLEQTDLEAKGSGCYLQADGGYDRERKNRMSRAGMIWPKLKTKMNKVKISHKTKGSIFRSLVVAALLYGIETKSPPTTDVSKMQTAISGYERSLYFGPGGGTKDMVGTITQAEIRQKLGTLSVQLEIDIRMLRYLGHLARMHEDRWEKKLLLGRLEIRQDGTKYIARGNDTRWEHIRILINGIMTVYDGPLYWYDLARINK